MELHDAPHSIGWHVAQCGGRGADSRQSPGSPARTVRSTSYFSSRSSRSSLLLVLGYQYSVPAESWLCGKVSYITTCREQQPQRNFARNLLRQ